MSHMKQSRVKAALAGAAAVAVALVGLGLTSTAASAAPGNPDLSHQASITVHKHTQPATAATTPHNGGQITMPSDAKPVAGVDFKVTPVDIDLSDWTKWADLEDLDPQTAPLKTTGIQTGTTIADGSYKFDVTPGVYLVAEQKVTTATVDGTPISVQQSAPFIVVVPSSVNDNWNYDVHVYPKGGTTGVKKTLTDPGAIGIGGIMDWNITASVPAPGPDEEFDAFSVTDTLEPGLKFDSISEVKYNGVDVPASAYNVDESGDPAIKLEITDLSVLGDGGHDLTFVFSTEVVSVPANGLIENKKVKIDYVIEGIAGETPPEVPVVPSISWGALGVTTVDADNNALLLEGAEYSIYGSLADAENGTNPIEVDGDTVFVSNSDGVFQLDGLALGTSAERKFWVVQNKAPNGYIKIDDPIEMTVLAGGLANITEKTVENSKPVFPALPITGGQGTMLFTAGGLILVAGAVLVAMRGRRKAQAATA